MSPVFLRARRCLHVHVSGRRCGGAAPNKSKGVQQVCSNHRGSSCAECTAMMRAFGLKVTP